jgi:hypothetical protein
LSVNDRLYDELLVPLVDNFYQTLETLAGVPVGDRFMPRRGFLLGRLDALEVEGNRITDVLAVPHPDWAAMRDLAVES